MTAAKLRTRFVPQDGTTDTFVVEDHRGSVVVAVGRVAKFGDRWAALSVLPSQWTPFRRTRKEAVEDLRREIASASYPTYLAA